jgi:sporulation protein YlmC with PRC-barrel domain
VAATEAATARFPGVNNARGTAMASVSDPNDTKGRLIAADQVEGTSVYNPAGESLGSVEDVMIDKISGKIAYAVVGFGGFLGIGDRHYPLPWEKLKYDTNMGGYVVDLDRSMIEGAPSYSDTETVGWEDPAWGRRVNDYYGTRPYWDMP